MASRPVWFVVIAVFALIYAMALPAVQGQDPSTPAIAPATPIGGLRTNWTSTSSNTYVEEKDEEPQPLPSSNPGTTIDQGIACLLMLLALVLTYIIHTMDSPFII